MEGTRHGRAEDVCVGDDRPVDSLAAHPSEELVLPARVVADLGHREIGACADLERELEQLRDEVALEALERVHGTAEEQVVGRGIDRPLGDRARDGPLGELAVHREQCDRVNVEHRPGETLEPVDRVVAGHGEDRPEAARQEVPAQALERVPVPVPGGHVDDDLVAQVTQRLGRCIRAQPGMATRVVGHRQGRDPRDLRRGPRPSATGAGHEDRRARRPTGRARRRWRTRSGPRARAGGRPDPSRAARGGELERAVRVGGSLRGSAWCVVLRRRSARTGSRR